MIIYLAGGYDLPLRFDHHYMSSYHWFTASEGAMHRTVFNRFIEIKKEYVGLRGKRDVADAG
jgi:hypothetical protein